MKNKCIKSWLSLQALVYQNISSRTLLWTVKLTMLSAKVKMCRCSLLCCLVLNPQNKLLRTTESLPSPIELDWRTVVRQITSFLTDEAFSKFFKSLFIKQELWRIYFGFAKALEKGFALAFCEMRWAGFLGILLCIYEAVPLSGSIYKRADALSVVRQPPQIRLLSSCYLHAM